MSAHERPAPQPGLRPSLGFWQVTVSGVGIVIGAGIYVLIGPATEEAGSAVWIAFVAGAVLAGLTGLSYAELAGMFPSAGAEYAFARHAFNEFTGFLTGWVMIAANIIGGAAVSLGFAHYVRHFLDIDKEVAAIALIVVLTGVIASGIRRSIWVSVVLVVLQVGGLVLVIAAGAPHIGERSLTEGGSIGGVWSAAALIFFAFIGFDEIVTLSEETRDPSRAIPRALLLALGISTILYVLVAIASVSVIGVDALTSSETPLTLVISHNWGEKAGDIVAVIGLAATTNTTLLILTAASRLVYGMSREASLPAALSQVSAGARSPWIGAVAAGAIAIGITLAGDISLVASATDLSVYAIFIVVNASLLMLRRTAPDAPRTFATPVSLGAVPVLPLLGILSAALMAVRLELGAWLICGAAVGLGVVTWLGMLVARRRT